MILLAIVVGYVFIFATPVGYTRLVSELTVQERLTTGAIDQTVKHSDFNEVVNFSPSSDTVTSDVDTVYSAQLTSGSTIDLTSLTNTLGNSMDLTGQRIMAVKFKNLSETGTDVINITQGATNPYPLFGSTFSLDLESKQSILYKCDTMLTDVDASNLGIDYTLNGDTLGVLLISARLY
ncbi:MAG: hypothetical protein K9J21_07345 [Bacteroidales bacterium]|nr:hypothetical protein [Bacteroidales bacterium]